MIERMIVAGGGTGGHLFPGIALVEEVRRRNPNVEVVFVGTERGIESRVIPAMGERLELLRVTPLKGRSLVGLLGSLWRLPAAGLQAMALIRAIRPDLVVGVGGYASGPMLAAAAAMRVPTAILEQNVHVGLTNRLLSPIVGRAYVSFPETHLPMIGARMRALGNPVRRSFVRAARGVLADPEGGAARSSSILVLGGSQGARCLNEEVPAALAEAGVVEAGFEVVHQTGEAMREAVEARYRELGISAKVVPFIDDMAEAYAGAALVIARAGATTVAEICAMGRASVLIPYPFAADDHQARNAEALAEAGAAVALREERVDAASLGAVVRDLLLDPARRASMAEAARDRGRPDAAAAIVDDLCEWLGCPAARAEVGGEEDEERESDSASSSSRAERSDAASELERRSGGHRGRPYLPAARAGQRPRTLSGPRRALLLDSGVWAGSQSVP